MGEAATVGQDLYAALHAQAAESGKVGGPHVPMCHTLAIAMLEAATGRRYRSKATITKAREALIAAGVITANVGQPWEAGVKSRPTVYNLLPASVLSELSPGPHRGIVHFGDTRRDTRPRWADRDRHVFLATVSALAEGRRIAEAGDTAACAPFERAIFEEAMQVLGGDVPASFELAITEEETDAGTSGADAASA